MNFTPLLKTKSKLFYISLGMLSILSSSANIAILMLINMVINGNKLIFGGHYGGVVFLLLIIGSFFSSIYFQGKMAFATNEIVFNTEIGIIDKLRMASYESFERVGREKIYTALGDARVLGRVPEVLISFINSSFSLLCSLGYLFIISPLGFFFILGIMLIQLCFYLVRNKAIKKDLVRVRDFQNKYYFYIHELMNGFKQIKLSLKRGDNIFLKHIWHYRNLAKNLNYKSSKKYITNELFGMYSWHITLGAIVFVLPFFFNLNNLQVASFIACILFMMAPLSGLLSVIPFYTNLSIAIDRIQELDLALNKQKDLDTGKPQYLKNFSSIKFTDLKYQFGNGEADQFNINIPSFLLEKNKLVFIVGGNGSGKTTFINLLTGMYKPQEGTILVNNKAVSWQEYQRFINDNMTAVFTDNYLFKENYDGHDFSNSNSLLNSLKKILDVNSFFNIDAEYESINTSVSKGQQKRLALLLALLEDKPILVLDEWAAEQDPYNRSQFYNHWINKLKEMNKTVIIISHDDDYYNRADRIVKFNFGNIVSDITSK